MTGFLARSGLESLTVPGGVLGYLCQLMVVSDSFWEGNVSCRLDQRAVLVRTLQESF